MINLQRLSYFMILIVLF